MSTRIRLFRLAAGLALALPLAACLVPPPPDAVFVRVAPPAAIVETRTASPGADFYWIDGYYRWDGGRHVWVGGHYERRPNRTAVWAPGAWHHHSKGWYWTDGHWSG